MKSVSKYLGARASNAGDQFHELWALRRALSLLEPSSNLKALTVEGVASEEIGDENPPTWDGVDCALYFGGATLETAQQVDLVQLKYSASHPNALWTVARLTASTKKDGNNSVLRRLADDFVAARTRIRSGARLRVRLVSNQPLAPEVSEALDARWSGALAGASLSASVRESLEKIAAATGLNDDDLSQFLSVVDASECGSFSNFGIRDGIAAFVSDAIGDVADSQVRELQTRIRELMLPERTRDVVTFEVVLGWFGIASDRGLFPAPPDLKRVERGILRDPAKRLLGTVKGGSRLTCLHGPAGCGKTTTLMQLETLLPEASAFVIFDCYGAGRYGYTTDRRHLPENAFTQIANDLSLKLGIPFLLVKNDKSASIQRFLDRIQRAGELLKKAQPKALLVVGIDAADNSVTAATRPNPPDPCFVHELVGADLSTLPDNIRFVISTRTGRKDTLKLPGSTVEVECPAFVPSETAELVRLVFPKAGDAWIDQFQALSSGVPRVQDYAFKAGNGDPNATLNALRPSGKGVSDVLRQLFDEALKKIGEHRLYSDFMAALSLLPAPVPPIHIAAICKISQPEVLDLVSDIQPGLRLEAEGISIADEDVEDFISAEGASGLADVRERTCAHFSMIYRTDAYAATHYADILAASGRASQILPIIEADLAPAGISDPIVRREVQVRRLRLALSGCRSAGDPAESLKVILLSGEAAKDEAALTSILENESDLAVRFARASLVRLVLADPDRAQHQGSVLAQNAARAARAGDRTTAREQLYLFEIWLKRRKRVSEQERHSWKIEHEDLVAWAEAIALLAGPERALRELRRWSPRHLPLAVGMKLIRRLISRGNSSIVDAALQEHVLGGGWALLFIVPLALAGTDLGNHRLERALRSLRQPLVPRLDQIEFVSSGEGWQLDYLDLIVTACEIAFVTGVPHSVIDRILAQLANFDAPSERRYSYTEAAALDISLRAWFIHKAIAATKTSLDEFSDFVDPPKPAKEDRKRTKNSPAQPPPPSPDKELRKNVQAIFPFHESRWLVLERAASAQPLGQADIDSIKGLGSDDYAFARQYWATAFRARAAQSTLALMHLAGLPPDKLLEKAESLVRTSYDDPFGERLLVLWDDMLLRQSCHELILSEIVAKGQQAEAERAAASDKVRAFTRFSRIVLNFSEGDARALFERAIALAQEIDREAFDQISVLTALSSHFAAWSEPNRTEAACHAFRFITDIAVRLRDQEGFPWDDSVTCVGRLSPSAALASISRWSDEAIKSHEDTLPRFIEEFTRLRILPPAIGTALSILFRHPDSAVIRELIVAGAADAEKIWQAVTEQLARDCLLDTRPEDRRAVGESLLEAVENSGRAANSASWMDLRAMLAFFRQHKIVVRKQEKDPTAKRERLPNLTGRRFPRHSR
jgi:hypothetical protein